MNKRFLFSLVIALSVGARPLHCMETSSSTLDMLRPGFSIAKNFLTSPLFLAVPAIILTGRFLLEKYQMSGLEDIKEGRAKNFILCNIKKIGIKNPKEIKLKTSNYRGYYAHHNLIHVPKSKLTSIEIELKRHANKLIARDNILLGNQYSRVLRDTKTTSIDPDKIMYEKMRWSSLHSDTGQLQHEANHVKNIDIQRIYSTEYLCWAAPSIVRLCTKNNVLTGLTALACLAMHIGHFRHREQVADNQIEDNPTNIKTVIHALEEPGVRNDLLHPPVKTRINKFKKRIATIKSKNKTII